MNTGRITNVFFLANSFSSRNTYTCGKREEYISSYFVNVDKPETKREHKRPSIDSRKHEMMRGVQREEEAQELERGRRSEESSDGLDEREGVHCDA